MLARLSLSAGDREARQAGTRRRQHENKADVGKHNRAGGIACAIRDRDNYFVLWIDALESKIVLAQFRDGKPHQLDCVERKFDPGVWYTLGIEIHGTQFKGCLNSDQVILFEAEKPLDGFVGLWTARFNDLV